MHTNNSASASYSSAPGSGSSNNYNNTSNPSSSSSSPSPVLSFPGLQPPPHYHHAHPAPGSDSDSETETHCRACSLEQEQWSSKPTPDSPQTPSIPISSWGRKGTDNKLSNFGSPHPHRCHPANEDNHGRQERSVGSYQGRGSPLWTSPTSLFSLSFTFTLLVLLITVANSIPSTLGASPELDSSNETEDQSLTCIEGISPPLPGGMLTMFVLSEFFNV